MLEIGTPVRVYWNFHKKLFSVQIQSTNSKGKKTWKVAGHFYYLELENVKFKVSEAGRQRVLREQKKNVHAKIHGKILAINNPSNFRKQWYDHISYNPYKNEMFIRTNIDNLKEYPINCCDYLGLLIDNTHPHLQLFYSAELDK